MLVETQGKVVLHIRLIYEKANDMRNRISCGCFSVLKLCFENCLRNVLVNIPTIVFKIDDLIWSKYIQRKQRGVVTSTSKQIKCEGFVFSVQSH